MMPNELVSERRKNLKGMSLNELEDYLNLSKKASPDEKSKEKAEEYKEVKSEIIYKLNSTKPSSFTSVNEKTKKIFEEIKKGQATKRYDNTNEDAETNHQNDHYLGNSHNFQNFNNTGNKNNLNNLNDDDNTNYYNANSHFIPGSGFSFGKETTRIIEENNNHKNVINTLNNLNNMNQSQSKNIAFEKNVENKTVYLDDYNYERNQQKRTDRNERYEKSDALTLADLNSKNNSSQNFYKNNLNCALNQSKYYE